MLGCHTIHPHSALHQALWPQTMNGLEELNGALNLQGEGIRLLALHQLHQVDRLIIASNPVPHRLGLRS